MKRNTWFRAYSEALDDPKVQRLHPNLFKAWFNLLCLACEGNGHLPSDDDIAFRLRISVQDAKQHVDELILAGLIDLETSGARKPHNWETRQFVSDTSTERVRKHRETKKKKACNVSETPEATPPEQSRADTEQIQKEDDRPASVEQHAAGGPDEILGLNGATAEIVRGVANLLNVYAPDFETARRIVQSNVGLYGPTAVRDGYAEFCADRDDGKVGVPTSKTLVGYFRTAKDRCGRVAPGKAGKPRKASVLDFLGDAPCQTT